MRFSVAPSKKKIGTRLRAKLAGSFTGGVDDIGANLTSYSLGDRTVSRGQSGGSEKLSPSQSSSEIKNAWGCTTFSHSPS